MSTAINIPAPELQVNFSFALSRFRKSYLREALADTLEGMDISLIDKQLSDNVPKEKLISLAKYGMRGEILFPVPCILEKNPYLLGYYRLLLGYSQKAFYSSKSGVSKFKPMEEKGILSDRNKIILPDLCNELIRCAIFFVDGIGAERATPDHLHDLSLLTIGPQLRGGANVKKGMISIIDVFQAIFSIVSHAALSSCPNMIELENAAGRKVVISFAPDPDIVIREELASGGYRNIVAIEVKGGTDFSNIHNRVGEAEKSHQKAKASGYTQCWTVVNVDNIDLDIAHKESPSTNTFYRLSAVKSREGKEYRDFKEQVIALTGVRNST